MIDLSIIIVNWNTRDLLAQCLQSVYDTAQGLEFEVFVVDNASSDGSAQMVRECFPWVRLIENGENIGFARANNKGLQQAVGRYAILLNPDARLLGQALKALVGFMDAHPGVGAAGARLLSPDGTLQVSCHPMPTLFREFWRLFHLDRIICLSQYGMDHWNIHQHHRVEAIQGACMIVRQAALDKIGLLDEGYFMYSEEVDLCHRLTRAGWPVYWVPWAVVIHHGGQSTQQVAADMFLRLYESKLLFFRKHRGRCVAWAYKAILAAAAMARIIPGSLVGLLAPETWEWLAAKAHLYRRLLTALPAM